MAKFEHDGTVYPSLTDFVNRFAHESVTDRTFGDRLKRGWSVEDALSTPSRTCGITDHTGVWHRSIWAMAKAWGMGYDTVLRRLHIYHWSVRKALTTPVNSRMIRLSKRKNEQ
jgi:hypothetical protein